MSMHRIWLLGLLGSFYSVRTSLPSPFLQATGKLGKLGHSQVFPVNWQLEQKA